MKEKSRQRIVSCLEPLQAWRNFELVVEKAKIACQPVADHFADDRKMVEIGSQFKRLVEVIWKKPNAQITMLCAII